MAVNVLTWRAMVVIAVVVGCGSSDGSAPSRSSAAPRDRETPSASSPARRQQVVSVDSPGIPDDGLVIDVRTEGGAPASSPLLVTVSGVVPGKDPTNWYVARVTCDHGGYPLVVTT